MNSGITGEIQTTPLTCSVGTTRSEAMKKVRKSILVTSASFNAPSKVYNDDDETISECSSTNHVSKTSRNASGASDANGTNLKTVQRVRFMNSINIRLFDTEMAFIKFFTVNCQ